MKIISWNLNGLQSCIEHKSFKAIEELKPDIFCVQEIRTKEEHTMLESYEHIWNHANREKFSGTAVLIIDKKWMPLNVQFGFDGQDDEGRLITLEYEDFYLVNAYVPNAQYNLKRKAYRLEWDENFHDYIENLMMEKAVIICGDFNTTRSEIDVYEENDRAYRQNEVGLLTDERANLEALLELGLIDVFRELHPDERSYTWWSNRLQRRKLNRGWRLDYFLVSEELQDEIVDIVHLSEIEGSDHCPIMLEMDI